jgi:hypothetical protein
MMIPAELTDVASRSLRGRLTAELAKRAADLAKLDKGKVIASALRLDGYDLELASQCHELALSYVFAGDYKSGSLISAVTELCRGTADGDWSALLLLDEHDARDLAPAQQRAQKATRRAAHITALAPAQAEPMEVTR